MNITPVRVAVLDMYQGEPNEGMRNIKAILERFKKFVDYKVYDVRSALQVPDLEYDIYISSGGPGCPLVRSGSNLSSICGIRFWHTMPLKAHEKSMRFSFAILFR